MLTYDITSYFDVRQEFVDLYVDLVLNTSVEKHFKAFSTGFHEVCGGRVLELFHSQELMALIVGKFY
jgi:E3 ubiquitin-protein ligase HERC4